MRIISGLFDTRGDAETAVDALRAADIPSDDISVVTHGESGDGGVAEGADVGAAVGGEGIRRGGTLVSVRVDELKQDAASSILREAGGVDVNDRRSENEAGGLTGYDEGADLWNAEVSGRPIVPPTPR